MTAAKGRLRVGGGQGFNFGGAKAKLIKDRLRAIEQEQARTGRCSMFDAKQEERSDAQPVRE